MQDCIKKDVRCPLLFILVLEFGHNDTALYGGPLFPLLYADDIAVIAETRSQFQCSDVRETTPAKARLKLNVKKTEFISSGDDDEIVVDVNGDKIRQVDKTKLAINQGARKQTEAVTADAQMMLRYKSFGYSA